jgi:hypothetical protein
MQLNHWPSLQGLIKWKKKFNFLFRNDLRNYGIISDDIIRIIPVVGDAAERGTMMDLSLLSVICVCRPRGTSFFIVVQLRENCV